MDLNDRNAARAPQNQFSSRKPILQQGAHVESNIYSKRDHLSPAAQSLELLHCRLACDYYYHARGVLRCGEIAGVCKFGPSRSALLYTHTQREAEKSKSTFRRWARVDKKKQMHAARVRISTEY
jgi:hypothetical protein